MHLAAERDHSAIGGDFDALGLAHGLAHQRILNPVGQVRGYCGGLDPDVVTDSDNALERAHQALHRAALEVPVHLAARR